MLILQPLTVRTWASPFLSKHQANESQQKQFTRVQADTHEFWGTMAQSWWIGISVYRFGISGKSVNRVNYPTGQSPR